MHSDIEFNKPCLKHYKHWVWKTSDAERTERFKEIYQEYHRAGIHGLLFEFDNDLHYKAAKECHLEAHFWLSTLKNNDAELILSHPEWYAVNRNGESCIVKRPYVDYYCWLCPNQEGVIEYLIDKVKSILMKEHVDGIHLDYIRYCDVILPLNLWDTYGIRQTEELGEYDYCYCEVCRHKFQDLKGIDPFKVQFPDQNLSWRKFRYDSITRVVNTLHQVAVSYKKQITAAVFPTPEVAKRIVRQDWLNWRLTGIFPMIYHGFYREDTEWIGDAVEEGVRLLRKETPLFAGLYLPDFKNASELNAGIQHALVKGAAGISFFGHVDKSILDCLKDVTI